MENSRSGEDKAEQRGWAYTRLSGSCTACGVHTHAQAVRFQLTYSCQSSHAFADLTSALYALCAKLLSESLEAFCVWANLRVQFGVWVVVISTHYVWLAILMQDRQRNGEREEQTQKNRSTVKTSLWPGCWLCLAIHWWKEPKRSQNRGDQRDRSKRLCVQWRWHYSLSVVGHSGECHIRWWWR